MTSLFDFNLDNIKTEIFQDSIIYTIDNFYKHPEQVLELIESKEAKLWKSWETPSYNGVYFEDYRHDFIDERFTQVTDAVAKICGQPADEPKSITTNKIKFTNYYFNDYFNHYWSPHLDLGYTGLVYFDSTGTNLYERIEEDVLTENEHFAPWRLKSKYKKIKTLEAKFNRLVLFDGYKFLHGMAIDDDTFFKKYRLNQAIFFIGQPELVQQIFYAR
jgi:hypothetical protein